jgi:hypothetical protein
MTKQTVPKNNFRMILLLRVRLLDRLGIYHKPVCITPEKMIARCVECNPTGVWPRSSGRSAGPAVNPIL